jgi:general secretion pathway protein G
MDAPMKTREINDVISNERLLQKKLIEYASKKHLTVLDKRGFSLIELLVIVAIIGILATIALPAYSKIKDLAKNARAESEIRMIEKGIALYMVDHAALPNESDVFANQSRIDPWGNEYQYHKITDPADPGAYATISGGDLVNSDYDLYSKGKDGQTTYEILVEGTSSDDLIRCSEIGQVLLAEKY